jgi:hypothetical protein
MTNLTTLNTIFITNRIIEWAIDISNESIIKIEKIIKSKQKQLNNRKQNLQKYKYLQIVQKKRKKERKKNSVPQGEDLKREETYFPQWPLQ